MNCPVCKRTLAPTLSICLTCGAMMNDSVREELETQMHVGVRMDKRDVPAPAPAQPPAISEPLPVMPEPRPLMSEPRPAVPESHPMPAQAAQVRPPKAEFPRPSPPMRNITSGFSGAKTNPTLVEFQNKNSTVPDWRLQLQNSVRQRRENPARGEGDAVSQTRLVTNGANALKAEIIEEQVPQPVPATHANQKVANALKRINDSRKTFLPEENKARSIAKPAPAKSRPFNVVARNARTPSPRPMAEPRPAFSESPKPRLVPTFKIEKRAYDTNKLPRIQEEQPKTEVAEEALPAVEQPETQVVDPIVETSIHITRSELAETNPIEADVIEDLAPISMRFNSGLFDLIIGVFASFILVSPLVLVGGDWFSLAGVAAFGGVWGLVMFVYLTVAVGMHGKTLGMRMFGLELVDAEENDYPTFRQAAVHAAVYLLSLAVVGIGFIPMIFNDEQRAAHDLAAGTIIVTEF